MAGYSGTKLIDKLGIKPGYTIHIINAPENYFKLIGKIPVNIKIQKKLIPDLDFIHIFTKDKQEFEQYFPILKKHLSKSGLLWVSWPKAASKVKTDLNENVIRDIGLKEGLVDVKVCAVDEVWSGLKFLFRLKDRK